jgi:hypothetical protein
MLDKSSINEKIKDQLEQMTIIQDKIRANQKEQRRLQKEKQQLEASMLVWKEVKELSDK